jgi:hypothetical protein
MTKMLKYLYISALSHSKSTAFELAGCVTDANCLIVFWLNLLIIAEVYQGTLFCDNRLFIESILICDPALRRGEEQLFFLKVEKSSVWRHPFSLNERMALSFVRIQR